MSYSVYARLSRVAGINDVDPARADRGQYEPVAFGRWRTEATGAGVPAGMMQFIVVVQHVQPVYDLRNSASFSREYPMQ